MTASRAALDHQENAAIGFPPTFLSLGWFRAKILHAYLPFDRSINGKMKSPFYIFLAVISFIPFGCVRLAFFTLLLILHLAGRPADTYQMMNFIFTMKGTEFKSGGVILSVYAVIMYLRCATPGDPSACETTGPGARISKFLSVCDIVGSLLLSWIGFFAIRGTMVHHGEDRVTLMPKFSDIESVMRAAGFEEAEVNGDEIHRCFPPFLRLPPCVATVRGVNKCLERWPPGGKTVLTLLIFDFIMFLISMGYLWWLIKFDVASAQVRAGGSLQDIHYDLPALQSWWESPQANITMFHARICYHMLALPFMIFMAPGLSTILGLAARTGYNANGYCVPYTLRPVKKPPGRWSCEPKTADDGPARTVSAPATSSAMNGGAPAKENGRAACAPQRQCGF